MWSKIVLFCGVPNESEPPCLNLHEVLDEVDEAVYDAFTRCVLLLLLELSLGC
jgi:hypothetical protein